MSEASRIPPRPLRLHALVPLLVAVALGTLPLGAAPAAGEQSAQACPCSGPAIGGVWRSHGQYVSCVTRSARGHARASEISPGAARRAIRDGARSSCGKGVRGEGDVRVCGTNPVLPCPTVRTARVDDCAECAAALAGELVRCARVATPTGERDVCGERSLRGPSNPAVREIRTGVDCASCKAKLGTPQAAGLDCLVAACGSAVGSRLTDGDRDPVIFP